MLKLLKALVILALIGAIAAGLAGAYYYLVEQPRLQDQLDLQGSGPGQPTPDPGKEDFEKAQALKKDRRYTEAKAALESFLSHYPDSPHKGDVEFMLGDINMGELFSGTPGPGKIEYVVQQGDVLDRVARKTKSNPEMIFQANGDRVMLRTGQKLVVPQMDFSLEVHLGDKKLYLLSHGRFFKVYDILSEKPPGKKLAEIRTKVSEKRAFNDGKLVVIGSKDFVGSTRSLGLDKQPNYTIRGESEGPAPAAAPSDTPAPAPTGIIISSSDAEELYTLASIGTPVTISPQ